MDLMLELREIASRIPDLRDKIETEEATKQYLILPLIKALGYDVFNPNEVVPEYNADLPGIKKQKADYALFKDGNPIILFECKYSKADLDAENASQLLYYFTPTDVKIGVLTNGIIYRFFSDLDKQHVMDMSPFFEFNMLDLNEPIVNIIKLFSKSFFDLEGVLKTARKLKYSFKIKSILEDQLENPSDDFVKYFASQIYSGNITQVKIEQFRPMVRDGFKEFINYNIMKKLSTVSAAVKSESANLIPDPEKDPRIMTTEEELKAYEIVKDILKDIIDVDRVNIRDAINYCSIILDDTNRKPICRLYFNSKDKLIGIIGEQKAEEKLNIENINDIYIYGDRIKHLVDFYDRTRIQNNEDKSKIFFSFDGKDYEVRYWKDMFHQICNAMAVSKRDQFESIFQLSGRKNPLFSRNPGDLRNPELIEGTDVYVEVGYGAEYLRKLSKKVISLFGYPEESLIIKVKME
jgi:predicted type IV restriction endonuclease